MTPGLEVKFACEEAEKAGSKMYFMGAEFNQNTWERLLHETRMNFTHYFWKRWVYGGHHFYGYENSENRLKLTRTTPSQYSEKCLDSH